MMPFALTNAHTTFQAMTNTICKDAEGCVHYMEDIRIYGEETENEHPLHGQKILLQVVNSWLAVNLTKYEFHIHETILLGHIVNGSQVQMDAAKLDVMYKWPVPMKKKELQAFLGFANYYSRSMENNSAKACPVIDFAKDVASSRVDQQQQALNDL